MRRQPKSAAYTKACQAFSTAFRDYGDQEWEGLLEAFQGMGLMGEGFMSKQDLLDLAFDSYNIEAVLWVVRSLKNPNSREVLSKSIFSRLSGPKGFPRPFMVKLLDEHPGIIDGAPVYHSTCLNQIMCDALIFSDAQPDFRKLCTWLARTGSSSKDSGNGLRNWLDFFSKSSPLSSLPAQLMGVMEKDKKIRHLINSCLPIPLSGYTVPAAGPFIGVKLPVIEARTLPQLLGWTAGPGMKAGMSYPCARQIWDDPVGFSSWLPIAAHNPGQLARMIGKYPSLRRALDEFRDEQGRSSVHVIAHARLLNETGSYSLLEQQLIRHCPGLYTRPCEYNPSVPEVLAKYFPSWDKAWRRALLSSCVNKNPKPGKTPPPPRL